MQIEIKELSPDSSDATRLTGELDTYLNQLSYPAESRHAFTVEQLVQERVTFFVAYLDGELAGCGGLKLFGTEYGEVKRMYVRPALRGSGIGKRILEQLSDYSRSKGVDVLRLETGIHQTEAIRLYARFGFVQRPPFGDYQEDPFSVYFEKVVSS
jgi:putative acetyltransferase